MSTGQKNDALSRLKFTGKRFGNMCHRMLGGKIYKGCPGLDPFLETICVKWALKGVDKNPAETHFRGSAQMVFPVGELSGHERKQVVYDHFLRFHEKNRRSARVINL